MLKIRSSATATGAIRRAARRAARDLLAVLPSCLLGAGVTRFDELVADCVDPDTASFGFAALNDYLSALPAAELGAAVEHAPRMRLDAYTANYVAALVESACVRRRVTVPAWVLAVEPLPEPVFGSSLLSLRLHLLINSPAAFRRRNIFVDAGIGDRV